MKVLHTSDIHLREYQDARWNALVEILRIGKEQNINFLAISGDLFDKDVHSEKLRPKLRQIFSDNDFKILIIPGNHDKDSFESGVYLGEDVVLFNDLKTPYITNNLVIWGFPFEYLEAEDIINKLREIRLELEKYETNILLLHGELLDAFFWSGDIGDEGDKRYMPVKLSYFSDLNFKYILAGHIHTKFEVWQLGEEKYFVYSGSPVSTTKKEIGRRRVNIFEIGKPPTDYEIDTDHYEEKIIEFDPFNLEDPLEIIRSNFVNLHPNAKIIMKLKGYLDCNRLETTEEEFHLKAKELVSRKLEDFIDEVQDISKILEDDLFKKFTKKTKEKELDEEQIKLMQEYTIRSMMGVKQ